MMIFPSRPSPIGSFAAAAPSARTRSLSGRRLLSAQPPAGACLQAQRRARRRITDRPADHRDPGRRRFRLHPDQRHLHHRRSDLPRNRPFLLRRPSGDQRRPFGLPRRRSRAGQGDEAGCRYPASGSGPVSRDGRFRPVRFRPRCRHPACSSPAVRAWSKSSSSPSTGRCRSRSRCWSSLPPTTAFSMSIRLPSLRRYERRAVLTSWKRKHAAILADMRQKKGDRRRPEDPHRRPPWTSSRGSLSPKPQSPEGSAQMPSLKAIKKADRSVKNTRQITKAMKMVSAAKLRRAQEAVVAARPYADKMQQVLSSWRCAKRPRRIRSCMERGKGRALVVLLTADRGLCGGFNGNISKASRAFYPCQRAGFRGYDLMIIGRKGRDYLQNPRRDEHRQGIRKLSPARSVTHRRSFIGRRDGQPGMTDETYDAVFWCSMPSVVLSPRMSPSTSCFRSCRDESGRNAYLPSTFMSPAAARFWNAILPKNIRGADLPRSPRIGRPANTVPA